MSFCRNTKFFTFLRIFRIDGISLGSKIALPELIQRLIVLSFRNLSSRKHVILKEKHYLSYNAAFIGVSSLLVMIFPI